MLRAIWGAPLVKDVAFYGLAIAGLRLNLPLTFPALDDAATGELVISTLWMVEASTIALSIAIIVFALQSFVNSTPGSGSLKEVVEDSHLLWLIRLGIAGLVVDGLVLVRLFGAPTGWAATWAVLVSGASIPGLAVAVRLALTSVDPGTLHLRRLKRLRRRVHDAVRDEMLTRLAQAHLSTWGDHTKVTVDLLIRTVPTGWIAVLAPRDGIVSDLSLTRLATMTDFTAVGQAQTRVVLFVGLGSRVQGGRPLCALPPGASGWVQCRVASAFRVRR